MSIPDFQTIMLPLLKRVGDGRTMPSATSPLSWQTNSN
jgi:hypothetical protein